MFNEVFILIVSLLILIVLIYKFMGKHIIQILDSRIHSIREELERVKHEKNEALKRFQVQQKYYLQIKKECDSIIDNARQETKKIKENSANEIESIFEYKREQIFHQIEHERDKALHDLQVQVVDLAMETVEELIKRGHVAMPSAAEEIKKLSEQEQHPYKAL